MKMKKLAIFIILVLVIVGGYFGVTKLFNKESHGGSGTKEQEKDEPKLQIFDEESDSRVVAVMINNRHQTWPHAGLQDSFLNYEILVEGGVTRILALFKDKDVEEIGSIRSSRPYFLDYALESDAVYVHWGGSDQAYSDISSLGIDHLDGMAYENSYFFRDTSYNADMSEHTGFSKSSLINEGIKDLGFRNKTNSTPVFNYSIESIDLSTREDSLRADEVNLWYSWYTETDYTYNEEEKVY